MDYGACSYRRFLDGDDNSLTEIVQTYKDGLILYLNGYVRNISIAEELTEDTFFRLITKKPKYSEKSSFKSFLYAIGRNVAVDYIRHNSKSATIPIEDAKTCFAEEQTLEQAYIKEENKLIINNALNKLTPEYRQVLWLIYFEDFSNKEAGRILKKSDRQMKNLLYRARKTLKEQLKKEGFDYEDI